METIIWRRNKNKNKNQNKEGGIENTIEGRIESEILDNSIEFQFKRKTDLISLELETTKKQLTKVIDSESDSNSPFYDISEVSPIFRFYKLLQDNFDNLQNQKEKESKKYLDDNFNKLEKNLQILNQTINTLIKKRNDKNHKKNKKPLRPGISYNDFQILMLKAGSSAKK